MAKFNLNPFANKIKYLAKDGKSKSIVRTGSSGKSSGISTKERTMTQLRQYWDYYAGEGTIFASINSMALNTVMVGYNLKSENKKAQEMINALCNKVAILNVAEDAIKSSLIFGDSFTEKIKNGKKEITRLKSIDPRTVIINSDEFGDTVDFQQYIGGKLIEPPLKIEDIIHLRIFPIPGSPYGLSLLAPSIDTINRKVATDESLFNAIQRHTAKYVISVGSEKDGQVPPASVMDDIKTEFEDITSKNEFIVPWFIKIDTIDERGVQGVREYFDLFQTQMIVGLMCPEEALGMGRGSTNACYDEETEVLTKRGWIKHKDLNNKDLIATYNPNTCKYEWKLPIDSVDTHVYDYKDKLIRIKSTKVDMLVTPNHKIWANKNPSMTKEDWRFYEAREILNSNSEWMVKYKADTEELNEPIDETLVNTMKFIGYFVSEGSINSNGQPYCRLFQRKEPNLSRMRDVVNKFNPNFKESIVKVGGSEFHLYDHQLYNWLKQFGNNCYDRHISREFLDKDPYYLKHLLMAAIDGDGTIDKRPNRNCMEYITTSKQLADDIQEIAVKCGYRTNLLFSEDKRPDRVGVWRVSIDTKDSDYVMIYPRMCEEVQYDGKVYCLNVPNHIYITRRNGKIAIQGNTAITKAILYERTISGLQNKLSLALENQLFKPYLDENGFDIEDPKNWVYIKFNSVTEEDDAIRAKWWGNILRGFRGKIPFSGNEFRAQFGLEPIKGLDELLDNSTSSEPDSFDEDKDVEEEDNKEEENEDNTLTSDTAKVPKKDNTKRK